MEEIVFPGDFDSFRLPPAKGLIKKAHTFTKAPVELHAARIRFQTPPHRRAHGLKSSVVIGIDA